MDLITKNPGLQQIAEAIFSNLREEDDFSKCQEVNTFWKEILDRPIFWLKKCAEKGLSNQYFLEWTKLIQQPKDQTADEEVTFCLKKMYCEETFLPPIQIAFIYHKLDMMKIMAPLSETPNAPFPYGNYFGCLFGGYTPIQKAVTFGYIEIIKILAPWSSNPDTPNPRGWTLDVSKKILNFGIEFTTVHEWMPIHPRNFSSHSECLFIA